MPGDRWLLPSPLLYCLMVRSGTTIPMEICDGDLLCAMSPSIYNLWMPLTSWCAVWLLVLLLCPWLHTGLFGWPLHVYEYGLAKLLPHQGWLILPRWGWLLLPHLRVVAFWFNAALSGCLFYCYAFYFTFALSTLRAIALNQPHCGSVILLPHYCHAEDKCPQLTSWENYSFVHYCVWT